MIKIKSLSRVVGVFNMGLIECDLDQSAERLVILDRLTMYVFTNQLIDERLIIKKLVPLGYVNNNNLMVGILDDNGEYNAAFIDGVKAQLVDANIIDVN
ncbi:hypothetical protein [Shewanella sp. TB4-MNA-CIBAN-0142]|uniref:hypothetical protein n=1 Tax=Shewanella sp. TB4-MNA-CIBAN-0142 TaxID=3140464 RepID=UPI00331ADCEE